VQDPNHSCSGRTLGRSPAGRASAKKRDPANQVAFLQVVPELTIDVVAEWLCETRRGLEPRVPNRGGLNRAGVVRLPSSQCWMMISAGPRQHLMDVVALRAFKGSQIGAVRSRFDAGQHHSALTLWAARPFDGKQGRFEGRRG
jgi:hypothetical protein